MKSHFRVSLIPLHMHVISHICMRTGGYRLQVAGREVLLIEYRLQNNACGGGGKGRKQVRYSKATGHEDL